MSVAIPCPPAGADTCVCRCFLSHPCFFWSPACSFSQLCFNLGDNLLTWLAAGMSPGSLDAEPLRYSPYSSPPLAQDTWRCSDLALHSSLAWANLGLKLSLARPSRKGIWEGFAMAGQAIRYLQAPLSMSLVTSLWYPGSHFWQQNIKAVPEAPWFIWKPEIFGFSVDDSCWNHGGYTQGLRVLRGKRNKGQLQSLDAGLLGCCSVLPSGNVLCLLINL